MNMMYWYIVSVHHLHHRNIIGALPYINVSSKSHQWIHKLGTNERGCEEEELCEVHACNLTDAEVIAMWNILIHTH